MHHDTVTDLVIDGEFMTTTEGHPFWSVTYQEFVRADQLTPGHKILTADGQVRAVSGLSPTTERTALAYNLEVQDIHTYHVGTGEVLVHNDCDFAPTLEQGLDYMADRVVAREANHIIKDIGDPCIEAGRCAAGETAFCRHLLSFQRILG